MDSGELLTVADAAAFLDRSTEQVRRYLRESRLDGTRIGGQWFIERQTLEEFNSRLVSDTGFLARVPIAADAKPLDSIIAIGSGGGSNLSEGKESYRRTFRWRQ